MKRIKVIITGATGMVGEGVMLQCLEHPEVEQVLLINRKPSGVNHPKVKEIVHKDFLDISPIEDQLGGYDACFFCLGVSSVGMKEPEYTRITYTLTLHVAGVLSRKNPDMVFCYVSGSGTDSTEKGRMMWARVKGKTENDLMKLPFRKVYAFRPAFIKARKEQKNVPSLYYAFSWLFPVFRPLIPGGFGTVNEIGLAMINTVSKPYPKTILEVGDIRKLSLA